ncbi:family with sequence similarity 207 member A L homeolog isoform X1 [Xenopus laevis]|uniref:Family with sequence similarity 207 member A L homeolog isoform X1 n=1 Tax=Xenopus laevis TaxID=8355 RepID=A0A8J0TR72_XENLA|nr:family with sequence similarity 207 member A L homeolog isoform X1 [Xenopus laevis]
MVGKIKRARQKFHQAAIRVGAATEEEPPVPINEPPDSADLPGAKGWEAQGPGKDWTFFSSNIFSSTKINPESLTQKLEVDTKSVISDKKEEKILVPKKEKAKQRRERWLQSFQPWNIFAEVFNIINLSLNNPWSSIKINAFSFLLNHCIISVPKTSTVYNKYSSNSKYRFLSSPATVYKDYVGMDILSRDTIYRKQYITIRPSPLQESILGY